MFIGFGASASKAPFFRVPAGSAVENPKQCFMAGSWRFFAPQDEKSVIFAPCPENGQDDAGECKRLLAPHAAAKARGARGKVST
ncbi:MAG: hypothetical protein RIC04_06820 [Parvibaculum sp.]